MMSIFLAAVVLQGLDGVEKNQAEDVGVGAVGRLVDAFDLPTASSTHRCHL